MSKRKRSANYIPQEMEKLNELLDQYRTAIEDKRTGGIYLARKKEAWDRICSAYNSTAAVSGPRTVEQLKVFYDNKKQKAKRELADHKKKESLKSHNISECEIDVAMPHVQIDKVELKKSLSSTSLCSNISDHEMEVINMNKEQVTSLPHSCDSAAEYFGDDSLIEISGNETEENETIEQQNTTQSAYNSSLSSDTHKKENINMSTQTRKFLRKPIKYTTHTPLLQTKNKLKKCTDYKQLYFKMKCQNVYLERKKIYQDIRMRQKEHSMFVKEHSLKMNCIEEKYKMKFKISDNDIQIFMPS